MHITISRSKSRTSSRGVGGEPPLHLAKSITRIRLQRYRVWRLTIGSPSIGLCDSARDPRSNVPMPWLVQAFECGKGIRRQVALSIPNCQAEHRHSNAHEPECIRFPKSDPLCLRDAATCAAKKRTAG